MRIQKPISFRHHSIDILRAISIIGVIAIHVLFRHYGQSLVNNLWNYLQFVVVTLIFCSGYLMAVRYDKFSLSAKNLVYWYKKRFNRLYLPYLCYALIHFLLFLALPTIFSGVNFEKTNLFIVKSLTLSGGIDIGWLTLLFLQLALISPFILRFIHNRFFFYTLFALLSFIASLIMFVHIPEEYSRLIGWAPWTLVLLVSFTVGFYEKKHGAGKARHKLLIASIISLVIFFELATLLTLLKQNTLFVRNKYPPNIFYLSYGIGVTGLLYYVAHLHIWGKKYLQNFFHYTSKNAYPLFFIHYIIIDGVMSVNNRLGYGNWWFDLLLVTTLSYLVMLLYDRLSFYIRKS